MRFEAATVLAAILATASALDAVKPKATGVKSTDPAAASSAPSEIHKVPGSGAFFLDEAQGVKFEPDLTVGQPRTAGATVTKLRYGPYKL
jgi:hypothetical protein